MTAVAEGKVARERLLLAAGRTVVPVSALLCVSVLGYPYLRRPKDLFDA
jgi:hypothetical protein